MNLGIIMGRLAAEPEIKKSNTGKDVLSFTVAVPAGKDSTDWVDCVAWEKTAQFIAQYFHKGSMIAVTGHLKPRTYEDLHHHKRKTMELVADRIDFCGGKEESKPETLDVDVDVTAPEEKQATANYKSIDIPDEDLPF